MSDISEMEKSFKKKDRPAEPRRFFPLGLMASAKLVELELASAGRGSHELQGHPTGCRTGNGGKVSNS